MKTKKAVCIAGKTAKNNKRYNVTYRKAVLLSSLKNRLFAEIRNLFCLLGNPFLSPDERATCELLFWSTVRKLMFLQNGAVLPPHRISGNGCMRGFSCAESTNTSQRVV